METVAILISAVAAFFSAVSAAANFIQAGRTRSAGEAQVFLDFSSRYQESVMSEALAALASFWRESGRSIEGFLATIDVLKATSPEEYRRLYDLARRVVLYFGAVATAYENRLISRRLVRTLISTPGINVFYDLAVPFAVHQNPTSVAARDRTMLQHILRKFGDGLY